MSSLNDLARRLAAANWKRSKNILEPPMNAGEFKSLALVRSGACILYRRESVFSGGCLPVLFLRSTPDE